MEPSCIGSQIFTPVSTVLVDQAKVISIVSMCCLILVIPRLSTVKMEINVGMSKEPYSTLMQGKLLLVKKTQILQRAASIDDVLAIFVQPQIVAIGSFDLDKFFLVCKGVVYSILNQSIV
ncbi:hypothetical protein ACROYT_G034011 [Oculina patagonica]